MVDEKKIPLQAVLQALVLAMLGAGGYVGSGAFEDLRTELVQQRIETAEMRKVVEAMDQRMAGSSADVGTMRAKIDRLEAGRL